MKKLNICVDIDGTITEPFFWLSKAAEYFNKKINIDNYREYALYKVLGITREEYHNFYEKYKFDYHPMDILRRDVSEVINQSFNNNNIYFVTARDKSLFEVTSNYLKRNNIFFNELYVLGSHYKVEKARELDCDVFIEDNPSNAKQLSEAGFKVLLMDTTYNKQLVGKNIIRVFNWKDISYELNSMLYSEEAI